MFQNDIFSSQRDDRDGFSPILIWSEIIIILWCSRMTRFPQDIGAHWEIFFTSTDLNMKVLCYARFTQSNFFIKSSEYAVDQHTWVLAFMPWDLNRHIQKIWSKLSSCETGFEQAWQKHANTRRFLSAAIFSIQNTAGDTAQINATTASCTGSQSEELFTRTL
jgi:hypothetical protein